MEQYFWHKNYPQAVPTTIEIPSVSLYYFLEQAAQTNPARIAVKYINTELSFNDLKEQVDRIATALHNLGVSKGDRIAVMLPNCPQTIIAYYAINRLGAVAVMTNPLYVERELIYQLKNSAAKAIIYLDQFDNKVRQVLPQTEIQHLISTNIQDYLSLPNNIQDCADQTDHGVTTHHTFEKLLIQTPANPPEVRLDPENDLAILQYTGGTTGFAKGAMLTHKNLVANVLQMRVWLANCEVAKEKLFCVLPFFHVFAMTTCMNLAILLQSTMIIAAKPDISSMLKLIEETRPTIFQAVPSLYIALLSHPDINKLDISSIRFCISGGAPLPMEVQQKFEAITGGRLVEGYGLTEASPLTHLNPVIGQGINGSIGLPVSNTNAKIMDLTNGTEELPLGEVGELCIKGPQVMKGYWNLPEETAIALRDGWLYTGDIAKMDENGFTYIIDRKKDLVITSGYNVYPREVEEILYEHPKVKEAAVIGIQDRKLGEVIKAFIVLKDGEQSTKHEIVEHCKKYLAKYKVPKKVDFRDALPKSNVGKILRRVLVEEEKKNAAQK